MTLNIKRAHIILHGGEPLLLSPQRFSRLCEQLIELLLPDITPIFFVQTNAMLINERWIELFQRYRVNVGVSMDLPADYNNRERIDFKGRGTYNRVMKGVALLREARAAGRIENLGVLCVINPRHDAKKIYRHFVDDLGFRSIDFLPPDVTYDSVGDLTGEGYGRFLCDLFDVWTADDKPEIELRVLYSIFALLLGGPSMVEGYGYSLPHAITIGSDGSINHNDNLRPAGHDIIYYGANVRTTTLEEYLKSPFISALEDAYNDKAETCQQCCWLKVCGGGLLVNRYSKSNGFKNPSVFCDGLKMLYTHATNYLLTKGLPLESLQRVLLGVEQVSAS